MAPDLTDADRERFARLRDQLDGVSTAERREPDRLTEFEPIDPMLAETFDGELAALDDGDWYAERKYDGTRVLLQKFDGEVKLFTRRHVERSETVPELASVTRETLPDGLVLDGEVTFVDAEGNSYFVPIHTDRDRLRESDLEPVYFVFDILVEDCTWICREPLSERKDQLRSIVPTRETLKPIDDVTSDFQAFYDQQVEAGEEGIVIKRRESPYHPATRSGHWKKVKAFSQRDVLAVGYTAGEGRRASTFGALVLTDGEHYLGRVGSGFTDRDRELLLDTFQTVDSRRVAVSEVGRPYQPIDPIVVSVKYQELTNDHSLRAPVYLGAKPDAPTDAVTPVTSSDP